MPPVLPGAGRPVFNTQPEFSIDLSPPRSNVMDIPACAQSCAQSAADSSGCSLADTNCICNSSAFASAGGLCIGQQCTPDEVQAAQNFFLSLCSGAFVLFHVRRYLNVNTGTGTSSSSPSS
ncbi:hypothetical protein EDB86DRAFT_2962069, partial [Lactarius hatsudake]